MAYSYKVAQDLVLDDVQHSSETNMTTRVKLWLNNALLDLTSEFDIPVLHHEYNFTTTSGTREYDLPGDVNGIVNVRGSDESTSPYTPFAIDIDHDTSFDADRPIPPSASTQYNKPSLARLVRLEGLDIDTTASAAATYSAVASGADTRTVTLVGYSDTARKHRLNQTKALTGAVSVDFATDIVEAIYASVGTTAATTVTISRAASAVGTIGPGDLTPYKFVMELESCPDGTYRVYVKYRRRPPEMVNDGDTPWPIPPEYHQLVVEMARCNALAFVDDMERLKPAMIERDRLRKKFMSRYRPIVGKSVQFRFGE